jgi:long-chain acyl-CoA synthetase
VNEGSTAGRDASGDTVHSLIERRAAQWPDRVYALAVSVDDGADVPSGGGLATDRSANAREIRFGALARSCRSFGASLRSRGLGPGDTVSVVMPNGLQTLRVLLGTMHAGMIVNPVNLLSQPDQMRYVLGHSDCSMVCVAPEWEARVREMLAGVGRAVDVVVIDPDGAPQSNGDLIGSVPPAPEFAAEFAPEFAPEPAPEPAQEAVALLMYTSGTTGVPKGVMLTQANLAANAHAISREHGLTRADRVLAVLPLYHINAFAVTMLSPLAHGGSLAMPPKFSAARFWDQAAKAICTWINVVPTMISYLIEGASEGAGQGAGKGVVEGASDNESEARRTASATIRFCRSASAALPPEHHRAFEARFDIGIIETMGLTETVAPSFSNPLEPSARKLGSVGRASGCEARVVDSSLQPTPDGTTGELVVRGPNVMRGYYKNEPATRDAFTPDRWLRTGDLGHRDPDGFFFVTGRIKELIIKGGENIAPREIDEALLAHPAVLDAAAVGIPDKHYGQEIMACVVVRDGMTCTEDELRTFCIQHLGRFKTPKVLRFVTELPRGPSGKVQRLKLLELPV